jgi:hypothetical protein
MSVGTHIPVCTFNRERFDARYAGEEWWREDALDWPSVYPTGRHKRRGEVLNAATRAGKIRCFLFQISSQPKMISEEALYLFRRQLWHTPYRHRERGTPVFLDRLVRQVNSLHELSDMYSEAILASQSSRGRGINQPVTALEECYDFKQRTKVIEFLDETPLLVDLLSEAYGIIQRHFPGCRVTLEVVAFPEEHAQAKLAIRIWADLSVQEAYRTLKQFDQDWFKFAVNPVRKKVFVDLEFL